jgi:membrane protein
LSTTASAARSLESRERERGRGADSPARIPPRGWKEIFLRVKDEIGEDRVGLIAAGCTFYILLALFPALAAVVAVYGLVADPSDVARQVDSLSAVLPAGGVGIIEEQLTRLTEKGADTLSFALVAGLLFSLWSANNGIKTMFEAMNVAFDERERRGFFRLTLTSLAFTAGAVLLVAASIFVVGIVPAILRAVGLGAVTELLISVLRWPLLWLFAAVAISFLYRYGPSRAPVPWRWVTPGSMLASALWILASVVVGFYLANFANYDATYGSLGAAIGFMTWLWLSIFIVIAGAELDAEIEHQAKGEIWGQTRGEIGDRARGEIRDQAKRTKAAAPLLPAPHAPSPRPLRLAGSEEGDLVAEQVGRAVGAAVSRHKLASLLLAVLAVILARRPPSDPHLGR